MGHREVLVLRYYRELSLEEMSEVLGCTVAAAKVRLHRARNVFKQQYVKIYGLENSEMSQNSSSYLISEEAEVVSTIR